MALSSLLLFFPRFLAQSAKLDLLTAEVRLARASLMALEVQGRQIRGIPQVTARRQANLVPRAKVSIFWAGSDDDDG